MITVGDRVTFKQDGRTFTGTVVETNGGPGAKVDVDGGRFASPMWVNVGRLREDDPTDNCPNCLQAGGHTMDCPVG